MRMVHGTTGSVARNHRGTRPARPARPSAVRDVDPTPPTGHAGDQGPTATLFGYLPAVAAAAESGDLAGLKTAVAQTGYCWSSDPARAASAIWPRRAGEACGRRRNRRPGVRGAGAWDDPVTCSPTLPPGEVQVREDAADLLARVYLVAWDRRSAVPEPPADQTLAVRGRAERPARAPARVGVRTRSGTALRAEIRRTAGAAYGSGVVSEGIARACVTLSPTRRSGPRTAHPHRLGGMAPVGGGRRRRDLGRQRPRAPSSARARLRPSCAQRDARPRPV